MEAAARDAFAHAGDMEREILSRWPGAWTQLDEMRARPPAEWPQWCLLPMAATAAYLSAAAPGFPPPPIAAVHALYTWRFARSVWLFEGHLAGQLLDQVPDAVPSTAELAALPEWCVYMAGFSLEWPGAGLWAHLESDANTGRPELRLLLDPGGGLDDMTAVPVYLDRPSLTEAIADFRATALATFAAPGSHPQAGQNVRHAALDAAVAGMADRIDAYISLIAYLLRPEADITLAGRPGVTPQRPRRPARNRRVWHIGYTSRASGPEPSR
jgi:hypothetical protein